MCRVWFCRACGQVLPEGLRCTSLFGVWLLVLTAGVTTVAMGIQSGIFYFLLIAYSVAALGYLFTYGGIRVCSPTLVVIGTLIHLLVLIVLPAAMYYYFKPEFDKKLKGTNGIVAIVVLAFNVVYWLWEVYYTMAASSAFALLNRQSCPASCC